MRRQKCQNKYLRAFIDSYAFVVYRIDSFPDIIVVVTSLP